MKNRERAELAMLTGNAITGMIFRRRGRPPAAFTLVELLVVVAIVAVLLAMLVPMLNRANQIARKVQCATNMKVTTSAVHMFAGSHFGRVPARAVRTNGTYLGFWGELADAKLIGPKMSKGAYEKGTLDCPEVYKDRTYLYWMQTFEINADLTDGTASHPHPHTVNGQENIVNGIGQGGGSGLSIRPAPPGFIFYAVGRQIQDFPRASMKFMFWEAQSSHGDEVYMPRAPANRSPVPIYAENSTNPAYAPWTSYQYGSYCFRHMVPADPALYRGQIMANFPFIDGHVEGLLSTDRINYDERFRYDY